MNTKFLHLSICFLTILVSGVSLYGQYKNNRENIWAFSYPGLDSASRQIFAVGLDFNQLDSNNNPSLTTTKMMQAWGIPASISDEEGNLLFYTNGDQVWDSDHNIMLNGDKIIPILPMGGYEYVTGTSCIVPFPDNNEKYYIFSITENIMDYFEKGKLFYSVVDMSLNGGKGAVDSSQSGILIDSGLSIHLAAIVGEQCNIWLLTCALNHDIKAFEITSAGIGNTPVISQGIGPGFNPYYDIFQAKGVIRASSNRKKLIITQAANLNLGEYGKDSAAVTIYSFDPRSGMVTNPFKLLDLVASNTLMAAYGACFSPDDSKLYINYGGVDYGIGFDILQFDLSSDNPATILSSKYNAGFSGDMITDIKQGPDGKLYFFYTPPGQLGSDMGNISQPNLSGAACQFSSFAFSLSIPKITTGNWATGLPNEVPIIPKDTLLRFDTIIICPGDEPLIKAFDTSGWGYTWSDGTTKSNYEVTAPGKYWVQYYSSICTFHNDTFIVKISDLLPPIISVDTFTLSTTTLYDTYQWLLNGNIIPGATDSAYRVTLNGNYAVIVGDLESGCKDTSDNYQVNNVTNIEPKDMHTQIKIYPNPSTTTLYIEAPTKVDASIISIEGSLIMRTKNAKKININNLAEGIYLIYIINEDGVLLKAEKIVKTQ